jgi:thioredoxin-like negative regulator of GroEL
LPPPPSGPFFSRVDWSAFWVATLLSLIVYVISLAPTVTLEDSGELAVAGDYLGVPHPPGYPSWTMIVWIFSEIFGFVRFRGQPNPAWSIALASAVAGALAAGITALLLCRSGRDMLRSMKRTTEVLGISSENIICWSGAVSASLIFAFSPVMWSQAVIVEVYALNAFFLTLVLLLAYIWIRRPSDKLLILTGLVFGIGLTNYQVLLLLLVPLVFFLIAKDLRLFRGFVLFGITFIGGIILTIVGMVLLKQMAPNLTLETIFPQIEALRRFSSVQWTETFILPWKLIALLPTFQMLTLPGFVAILIVNTIALILTYFYFPRGKTVAWTVLATELGLGLYLFMPIASDFNPPMNWGYPRTWEGFKHALSRGQYEKIVPTDIFSMTFIHQIGSYLKDLRFQFTLPIAILGFMPFTLWGITVAKRRFRAFLFACVLAIVAGVLVSIEEFAPGFATNFKLIEILYRLSSLAILILLVVGGFALVLGEIQDLARQMRNRESTWSGKILVGLILAGMAALYAFFAFQMLRHAVAPDLSVIQRVGVILFAILPVLLAVLVSIFIRHPQFRLEFEIDRDDQKWIMATVLSFLVMSVMLIALANPKGDIQDAFIQKVKFISSHALFAFWIGYGIIFGLAVVDTLFRGNRWIKGLGVTFVLLLPLVPIGENAYNQELVRIMGGAEQTGHDFGWQFGNYQLRGAEAISEEVEAEEEPLPNPAFPPEMGPRAIFFGGTDPGRFVPTYMIYSARVREDVYLITQNALADNTYMSVMRDLYGDTIYIPSTRDGNQAFQKYIEDVRTGVTPASADIQIENGRVSVQGVGGVMLINGILAQMIFDRNKFRHEFFVEESYVIQWMYPYLTPHGLIMKINREPIPTLPPEVIRNDLDFWDWYTRRLTSSTKFKRDVVAQKSFSKLRSAIAGLYAVRGHMGQSEIAFKEALELYNLSPEANFRLADLYLRSNRFEDAYRVMETFAQMDPANTRAFDFMREIQNRIGMVKRRHELETILGKGATDINQALELADIYRRMGIGEAFASLCQNILGTRQVPPQAYLRIAGMAAEERRHDLMAAALEKYLERVPADAKAWLDLAAVNVLTSKNDEALKAVQAAVRIGGDEIIRLVREDQRFAPLRRMDAFQRLILRQF